MAGGGIERSQRIVTRRAAPDEQLRRYLVIDADMIAAWLGCDAGGWRRAPFVGREIELVFVAEVVLAVVAAEHQETIARGVECQLAAAAGRRIVAALSRQEPPRRIRIQVLARRARRVPHCRQRRARRARRAFPNPGRNRRRSPGAGPERCRRATTVTTWDPRRASAARHR